MGISFKDFALFMMIFWTAFISIQIILIWRHMDANFGMSIAMKGFLVLTLVAVFGLLAFVVSHGY